jgi:hypothetical protein
LLSLSWGKNKCDNNGKFCYSEKYNTFEGKSFILSQITMRNVVVLKKTHLERREKVTTNEFLEILNTSLGKTDGLSLTKDTQLSNINEWDSAGQIGTLSM